MQSIGSRLTTTLPRTRDLGDCRFFLQRSAFAVSMEKSSSCITRAFE